ncbi:F17 fimbrial protein (F17 pilin) (F17 fimbrial adhesiveantigen) [Escherichia coli TA464]|uniref:fimbrial protein n=1 Tax=Escherichia coli TaxID=562 RepID=UPI000A186ED9|nr:fimbrial protein [Escherichia coli]OSL41029.1 F17 fimbrial protein (F17 pilin) (F17 fimbrial adhesiveantigen) [Escherichia coli TA464]
MKTSLAIIFSGIYFFAGSALASDGTINFTGKVVDQTCSVTTGDKNLTVVLPTVSKTALSQNGNTTGLTPFAIKLTGCSPSVNGAEHIKAFFEPGSNIDYTTHNLKNTSSGSAAQNVQVQLLNNDGTTTIQLGKDAANQDVHAESIDSTGNATLRYFAQYYATNAATAGDVAATVRYTIAYE